MALLFHFSKSYFISNKSEEFNLSWVLYHVNIICIHFPQAVPARPCPMVCAQRGPTDNTQNVMLAYSTTEKSESQYIKNSQRFEN